MRKPKYETSLTDEQWSNIQPHLPPLKTRGRPATDRRIVLDAILYVLKGGIPWRMLPSDFPSWKTVYHVFRKWALDRTWESINAVLRAEVRKEADKRCRPTAAVLDSQSVKSGPHGGSVGYDAAKKIKGRKRHLLVDTLGLVLGVGITPASAPEREGAKEMLQRTLPWFDWLRKLWVDGGYSGPDFAEFVRDIRPKLETEVIKRSESSGGFKVLPKRWVVERTFGWLMQHRRW